MATEIVILRQPIGPLELRRHLGNPFPDMVKYVVDVAQGTLALGGEMHADAEKLLLEEGSRQEDLWGGNVYPDEVLERRIEHTSLINIRPADGNRSIEVEEPSRRRQVEAIVCRLLPLD